MKSSTLTLPALVRSGTEARARVGLRVEVGLTFGVWTLVALLFGSSMYLRAQVYGEPISVPHAAIVATVDAYAWALVTLAAFWATRHFPVEATRWPRSVLVHAGFGLGLVVARALTIHAIYQSTPWFPERTWEQAIISYVAPNWVSYLMLVGVAHAVEYARRFRERETRSAHLETQLTRAQLQMLKMQLHPHFLFNTLHAISTLVHRDPEAAERMIASLSDLLRSSLAHGQAQEVSVEEEMALLEPYLEIEKTRLGDRLRLQLEVDPATRPAHLPHLILQPLVENAIRHGISPQRQGGRVAVATERVGDWLRVRVEDDGRGIAGPADRPGAVGLPNTRARLEQMYGARHRFEIHSRPGRGTRVELWIPFRAAGSGGEPAVRR